VATVRYLVHDVDAAVAFYSGRLGFELQSRNDIVKGPGGQQILCEDPSGNVVELFQAA
jgi:catechol 2,3-dioxygenase-like lactoylglutathione lyase family enzyme